MTPDKLYPGDRVLLHTSPRIKETATVAAMPNGDKVLIRHINDRLERVEIKSIIKKFA